jgi:hypothetical protein
MNFIIRIKIKFFNPRFRKWIELQEQKENISRAVDEKRVEFPKLIYEFLSTALNIDERIFHKMEWKDVIIFYSQVSKKIIPQFSIPLIQSKTEKLDPPLWDYKGRAWFAYSHILESAYGWTNEYVEKLPVFDAMAKIQEILLERQMEKEFLWSMSENSAIYDAKAQTSKPNPLPRPEWMKSNEKAELPVKKIRMKKSMLPVGNVSMDSVSKEMMPTEIIP